MTHSRSSNGFTLVEIMIVVAVLGILAVVAVPKFGGMIRNAKEGDVKSKLGLLRSALNIYFADNLANFPVGSAGANQATLSESLVPKYIPSMPACYVYPNHAKTTSVDNADTTNYFSAFPSGSGSWIYVSNKDNSAWGLVSVECYHTDNKGVVWSTY